jgi:hypothetical protein
MPRITSAVSLFALVLACFAVPAAQATVVIGAGGQGVPVGQSSLIAALDYSDTFTQTEQGGPPNRPPTAALQPAPAYVVQNTYGNPARNFQSQGLGAGQGNFSFASDGPGLVDGVPTYPGTSGAGSNTGITQTGGGVDYGLQYGLRDEYIVQVDAVAVGDRIDITSGGVAGTIFQPNSLSVFFRGDGTGDASLYNGTTDTKIQSVLPTFNTGITGRGQWHNYAVRFDRLGKELELFVDEVSVGTLDLTTFAGGLYQNFSNAAVGAGSGLAGGENRTWTDNFQVGGVVPEPGSLALVALSLATLLRRPRR